MYQLRLLDALLSLPNDTFNFVTLPGRRVVTVDDVAGASPTIKSLAANVQSHTWNSLDLFEVLVRLGESENSEVRTFVRDMLDKAVRISADIVHMGLLQVPVGIFYFLGSGPVLNYVIEAMEYRPSGVYKPTSGDVFGGSSQSSTSFHAYLANRAHLLNYCLT
jgi:hypothetical protein